MKIMFGFTIVEGIYKHSDFQIIFCLAAERQPRVSLSKIVILQL